MTTVPAPVQAPLGRRDSGRPAPVSGMRRGTGTAATSSPSSPALLLLFILLTGALAPSSPRTAKPTTTSLATMSGASWRHLLGTDQLGRDTLTRLIWGARTSMSVAFGATLIGALIGIPIGILAGWFGGGFDWVSLRLFELFTMVPTILAALLFITIFGVNIWKLALFIGITLWVGFARLMRAQFLALRDRDFVLAAKAAGVPSRRIVIVHILPNAVGPMLVFFVQQIPYVIFTAAGLVFSGSGSRTPPPTGAK